MPDELPHSRAETIRLWVQTLATVALPALAGFLAWYYQQVFVPATSPINLKTEVALAEYTLNKDRSNYEMHIYRDGSREELAKDKTGTYLDTGIGLLAFSSERQLSLRQKQQDTLREQSPPEGISHN